MPMKATGCCDLDRKLNLEACQLIRRALCWSTQYLHIDSGINHDHLVVEHRIEEMAMDLYDTVDPFPISQTL